MPCDSMMVMLPEQRDRRFRHGRVARRQGVRDKSSTLGGEGAFLRHAFADGRAWAVFWACPCPVVSMRATRQDTGA